MSGAQVLNTPDAVDAWTQRVLDDVRQLNESGVEPSKSDLHRYSSTANVHRWTVDRLLAERRLVNVSVDRRRYALRAVVA